MEPSARAPEKQPADYLNDIKVAEVTADTKTLSYTLPEDVPEGYKIKYNGTDYEQVIDLNGTIYRPISDVTVKASFKIENTKDNTGLRVQGVRRQGPRQHDRQGRG